MEDKDKKMKITAVVAEVEKDRVNVKDSGEITVVKGKDKTKEQDDDLIV